MRTSQVQKDILKFLDDRPGENAFLRSEFSVCSKSRAGVDKALRALVENGVLVRCGYGVLVRGKVGVLTGNIVPMTYIDEFSQEVLLKLGITPKPNSAVRAYNERRSTQVPAWLAFEVGKSRIVRKIYAGKRMVNYERNGKWVPLSR